MALRLRKLIGWLRRNRGTTIFALTLLVWLFAAANIWKHWLVSAKWLQDQKEALAALSSMLTMLILLVGAIFSYYRFFKGRTLSLRLELSITVSIHETPLDKKLHAITITAKNVGTSTVWNPKPEVQAKTHGRSDIERMWNIMEWQPLDKYKHTLALIESGETATFFALQEIPNEACAVTYFASVTADEGDAWFASTTVSNKEK